MGVSSGSPILPRTSPVLPCVTDAARARVGVTLVQAIHSKQQQGRLTAHKYNAVGGREIRFLIPSHFLTLSLSVAPVRSPPPHSSNPRSQHTHSLSSSTPLPLSSGSNSTPRSLRLATTATPSRVMYFSICGKLGLPSPVTGSHPLAV